MSKISKEKQGKIMSDIVDVLYDNSPQAIFTADISKSIGRDEEFVKKLLQDMREKGLIVSVVMNPQGKLYTRRMRWRLSALTYESYKNLHNIQ